MHPAIAKLTPDQAWALTASAYLEEWAEANHIECGPRLRVELVQRAVEVEVVPSRDHPLREDAPALREFMERVVALPPRMKQVATLCLEQRMSLRACGERMGISRETVRVHLRRLRALRRRAMARRLAHSRAAGGENG